MRKSLRPAFIASVAALSLGTSAIAGTASPVNSPLTSGKPAGVQNAALEGDAILALGALVLIGAAVAIASNSGGSHKSTTATTGTSS